MTFAEDRTMYVQPHQIVKTDWICIDACFLGSRMPMSPEAVEKKFRKIIQQGEASMWPPIVGHWVEGKFSVDDGRHEYLATLMSGRDRVFVSWLEERVSEEASKPSKSTVAAHPERFQDSVRPKGSIRG